MSVRVLLIVRAHMSLRVQESHEFVRVHVFMQVYVCNGCWDGGGGGGSCWASAPRMS